jgi:hypothetical protein
MGKRSEFEREKLDFYPTPYEAVLPLLPYLPEGTRFCEPCAGDGALISHLERHGHICCAAYDVAPQGEGIHQHDASWLMEGDLHRADAIITNPPWDRTPLHQIIERCARLRPTWLLFDADWAHTRQAAPMLDICSHIIAIGRVKWIAGTEGAGKDNSCWYRFDAKHKGPTEFIGRK